MPKKKIKSKSATKPQKRAPNRQPKGDLSALAYPQHLSENHLIEELRQTVEKLRIFDSLGKTLTSSLDLTEILRIVVEKLGSLVRCKHFGLVLLDKSSDQFYFEFPSQLQDKRPSFVLGRGLLGRCLERGKGGFYAKPEEDPGFDVEIDAVVVSHPSSMITLPIMSRGSVLGLLAFFTEKEEEPFTEEKFRLLETFGDYVAIAVENARNFKAVKELTIADDLTKLYNSRYLRLGRERELARSERYHENFSIVFMDLDNFKQINDQHGHLIGSQLLKDFGEFLLSEIRTSDVAIRYGGDEFVLVLPRTTKKETLTFISRLREVLGQRSFLTAKHMNVHITASFGVATFPEDGKNIDHLITAADKAMYVVKKGTKDGVFAAQRPVTLVGSKPKNS